MFFWDGSRLLFGLVNFGLMLIVFDLVKMMCLNVLKSVNIIKEKDVTLWGEIVSLWSKVFSLTYSFRVLFHFL